MRAQDVCRRATDLLGGRPRPPARRCTGGEHHHRRPVVGLLGTPITARDVARMMVLLKVARTKTGAFNLDDYVDAAGYAGIAVEVPGHDA